MPDRGQQVDAAREATMSITREAWQEYREAVFAAIGDIRAFYGDLPKQRQSTGGWVAALCPFHEDHNASFSYEVSTGNWTCHAGCGGGTLFDFEARRRGAEFKDTLLAMGDERGVPRPKAQAPRETVYDYCDADGQLRYQVVRRPGKKFPQRRPDGKGGYLQNLDGVERVLYRLPTLIARPGERVFVVEGEKDTDRLLGLGLLATTNSGGAGHWQDSHSDVLVGRDVAILPDNDGPGRKHAVVVAKSLEGKARSVRVVELPELGAKGDVSDWLNAGGTVDRLLALVEECVPLAEGCAPVWKDAGPPPQLSKPAVLITGRQAIEIVADARGAVRLWNQPPRVFVTGGRVSRLIETERVPTIEVLDEHAAYGILMRAATWLRMSYKKVVAAEPKKFVAHDMLANPDPALPQLDAVVTVPFFDSEWRLVTTGGYHPEARCWLQLAPDLQGLEVPGHPDAEELSTARDRVLDGPFVDFPFAAESDRTHAMASLLLPFVRPMFSGPAPGTMLESSTPGTGKTLLGETISTIVLGHSPGATTLTTNEEENRKKITALLYRGSPVIMIDNLKDGLASAQVAAALTADIWEDRILGKTQIVSVPNRALWLMSGNNPQLSMEIARRCIRVRLDSGIERPWTRKSFVHDPIREWVLANRRQLVTSILTLVQHWIDSGAPPPTRKLGSFEGWSYVVGGIVEHIGMTDFLGDTEEFYETADSESGDWRAFIDAWLERFRNKPVGSSELLNLAIRGRLVPFALDAPSEIAQRIKFGRALGKLRDRRFGDLRVVVASDSHSKSKVYSLQAVEKELQL